MKEMKEKVFLCGKGRGLWKEPAWFLRPSPVKHLVGQPRDPRRFSPFLSLRFFIWKLGPYQCLSQASDEDSMK